MKRFFLVLMLCGVLLLSGCRRESVAAEISLADHIPQDVTKIALQNAHNGQYTFITNIDSMAEIRDFLRTITGTDAGSGKGYYEGSYYIAFYHGDEKTFSMAFGDSDCLYMGDYGDGYPIRYLLKGITIAEDVIPFFSQFDGSLR